MKIIQFTIPVTKEYSIIVQEDKLPYFYNHLHRHSEIQITWIIKGEGTLIAGSCMQGFKPVIFISSARTNRIFLKAAPIILKNSAKAGYTRLPCLLIQRDCSAAYWNCRKWKNAKQFLEATNVGLQVPGLYQRRVSNKLLQVKEAKNGFRLAAFINLLQDLAAIKKYKTLSDTYTEYTISEFEGLRMNDIYQYTMSHYTENITLEQISSIAYLTPQAFCRYFKKHTCKTYITFLNEIRINEACKKIVTEEFGSLASVAYQTGFTNPVTFNRVFKK